MSAFVQSGFVLPRQPLRSRELVSPCEASSSLGHGCRCRHAQLTAIWDLLCLRHTSMAVLPFHLEGLAFPQQMREF